MTIARSVWAGAALLAMAQAAVAAPLVSGKYALMTTSQCTAKFSTTTDTYRLGTGATAPAVKTVNPLANGELNAGVGTITFPLTAASTGAASVELSLVSGSLLRINGGGNAMATHTETISGTFSLTNTTFTLTPSVGPAMTWTMRPGNIVTSGVARTLYMVRKEDANCLNTVTATKQY